MAIKEGLTFDDVLLQPKYSEIKSRSGVDLSVQLPKGIKVSNPIIPANMKTVTGKEMAKRIADTGGLAILHRFMPLEEQLKIANEFVLMSQEGPTDYIWHIGYSIGVKEEDYKAVKSFAQIGCARILCVDVAHGDSLAAINMCKYISEKYPEILLIVGNVATGEAARRLWFAGADLVKVGVGSGTICSTRLETGNGVPQLTALMEVAKIKQYLTKGFYDVVEGKMVDPQIKRPIGIISDGGCNKPADICKSLCFADLTMIGGMVAGTDECPTTKFEQDGKWYKRYDGSSTYKGSRVEGVKAFVPYKGPVQKVLNRIFDGLQSCCSYQGVDNLVNLKRDPQFIRITNNGVRESNIHDVIPTE